jgi:lipopolysaccharide transport system permease protein
MAVDLSSTHTTGAAPAGPEESFPVSTPSLRQTLGEIWRSRTLFWHLSILGIRRMFRGTFLGPMWLFIHVLMDLGSKTFVFGSVLGVAAPNDVPYIVFLLSGMIAWRLFQQTLTLGVKGFLRFSKLGRTFYFPLPLVPVGSAAQALVDMFVYLAAIGVALTYYGVTRHVVYLADGAQLLLAPYGLFLSLLFAWGLCFWLAPLNYRARDIRFVLRYGIGFWLYVTPVVYPLDRLHGVTLWIAKLNPMAPIVEMTKFGLTGTGRIGVNFALWGTAAALTSFFSGLWFLNRFGSVLLSRQVGVYSEDDDEDEET